MIAHTSVYRWCCCLVLLFGLCCEQMSMDSNSFSVLTDNQKVYKSTGVSVCARLRVHM